MTFYHDFLAWLPALLILGVTVLFYIGFRIVSIRVIRFILDKLPFAADENIAAAVGHRSFRDLHGPGQFSLGKIGPDGLCFQLRIFSADHRLLLEPVQF